jgi:hypothetical protein
MGFGAASAFDSSGRTAAYVLGGLYVGVGLVQIASGLLSESLAEKIWRRYKNPPSFTALTMLRLDIARPRVYANR